VHPLLRFTLDLFDSPPPQAPAPGSARPRAKPSQAVVPPPNNAALPATRLFSGVEFVHPQATRQVHLDGVLVAYALVRGKRRTIGMVVGPDGLNVRAPRWTPLYEIDAALQDKAQWIVRKLRETRERHTQQLQTRIEWRDGAQFPYLGGTVRLLLDPSHRFVGAGAQLDDAPLPVPEGAIPPLPGAAVRLLRVALPPTASAAQIRDAVQAWLMRQALDLFAQRLAHFAPLLQVQHKRLALSSAGTRWGSARSDGSIRLNWRLMHFALPVIDYVVAHELSHLRVMNHSPLFWDMVRSVVPDYPVLRGALKTELAPVW
jgi:predicted metal-dependent hydrolase